VGVERGQVVEVGHPEAVRADHPYAGCPADREQLVLARTSLRSDLGEAGRQHHERAHALGRAFAAGLKNPGRRHRDDGELDVTLDVGDAPHGRPAGDLRGARIDEVQRPGEASGEQVARDPLALLEVVARLLRERGRELDLDRVRLTA
jgi:hypothetical protein